jgi:hypothetical protein
MQYFSSWRRSPRSWFAILNLKPSGLRRSTPASLFQQRPGHSPARLTKLLASTAVREEGRMILPEVLKMPAPSRTIIAACGLEPDRHANKDKKWTKPSSQRQKLRDASGCLPPPFRNGEARGIANRSPSSESPLARSDTGPATLPTSSEPGSSPVQGITPRLSVALQAFQRRKAAPARGT